MGKWKEIWVNGSIDRYMEEEMGKWKDRWVNERIDG